jgi:hypothetical protein
MEESKYAVNSWDDATGASQAKEGKWFERVSEGKGGFLIQKIPVLKRENIRTRRLEVAPIS